MKAGWEIKRIGDICKTSSGGTPLKIHKDYYEGGNIPWLLSGEVSQMNIFSSKNFITQKGFDNSSAKLFPRDTVLVAMYGANAGQVGILRFESATNQAVCGIFPNKRIITEFLYHYLFLKQEDLAAQAVGGAQPNISQAKIKDTIIPVPPLPEQRRIVAILDEAFAGISAAKESAEKNLKNAKEVFEAYLKQILSPKEDWIIKKMSECFKLKSGEGLTSKEMSSEGIYPVYGGNGVSGMYDNFNLSESNIIIGRVGSLCGNVRHVKEKIWLTDNAFKVVTCKVKFDFDFLCYLLSSKKLRSYARQAAQPVISNSSLSEVLLEFPYSVDKQKVIVSQLDGLSGETSRLESIYQQKLVNLEELKKSLLQQAFSGAL